MAVVLAAGALAVLASNTSAATLAWTGATNSSWFTASNWSPAQVPTSADDVLIDTNSVVIVPVGSPSLAFNTLTLGDASATFTPTLKVSAAASTAGVVTVSSGAVFQQDTTAQLSFGGVTVLPGGKLTHTANGTTKTALVNFNVTGDFNLQPGALIWAAGLGYAGGAGWHVSGSGPGGGPGAGSDGGSGGGHGGIGGTSGSQAGGTAYDSITTPADLGSGGAGAYAGYHGGAGGGALILNVGGTLTINGTINASGGNGVLTPQNYGSGGGAGGTVNLTAVNLAGSGSVLVNGGAGGSGGNTGGGGGAGGRVAIKVTGANTSGLTLSANAGTGAGTSGFNAGAGVVAVKSPAGYDLAIGTAGVTPQAATQLPGTPLAFDAVTLGNAIVGFDAGAAVSLNTVEVSGAATINHGAVALGAGMEVKPGGTLQLNADSTSGGALLVDGGGTFKQMSAAQFGFASVSVQPGGLLTHAPNTTTRASVLNLSVTNDFNLQAGASISVSGLGYAGGAGWHVNGSGPGGGPGPSSDGGSGGGHGGIGGTSGSEAGGASYDSSSSPTDLGSGGSGAYSGYSGGAGGGAVLLAVGGNLYLNGLIAANGANGVATPQSYGSGGGAGGTVNVTAAAMSGAGGVQANGGAGGAGGNTGGGGGGGGRVAVVVTGANTSALAVQANAGNGSGNNGYNGGSGVVALKSGGDAAYSLSVGNLTQTPQTGSGVAGSAPSFLTVTLNNGIVNFDAGSTVTINSLVAVGAAAINGSVFNFGSAAPLTVQPGASLQLQAGRTTFPTGSPIEVRGLLAMFVGATSGGALNVRAGGTFKQANAAVLNFDSVLVEANGTLTHAANATTRAAILNLNVAGGFNLQAGANIAVNGLGYTGGPGWHSSGSGPGGAPGAGSDGGAGGGHGGVGGTSSAQAGGAAYDSVTNPTDLGSGGGGAYAGYPGGAGGGAVLLNVGGTFTLGGTVSANGANGVLTPQNYGTGAGAGGTINLTAKNLSGAGTVQANGGVGGNGANTGGGGGAGGRVAIVVGGVDTSSLSVQAHGGSGSGNAAYSGGAGVTARLNGGTTDSLFIGDPFATPQAATPLPGASLAFDAVTLGNALVGFDGGSTVSINSLAVAGAATVNHGGIALGATLEVKPAGTLQLNADSTSGGALLVDGGGTFKQMSAAQFGFASVNVLPGGLLTHAPNTTTRASVLNLSVTNDFNLQAGSSISVSGLGYAGGAGWHVSGSGPGGGPGAGSDGGSGGGHGGVGGTSASQAGGAAYDSASNPTDLGSGGAGAYAGYPGGAGGGAVLLSVGGNFYLNGSIAADGASGIQTPQNYGTGGGAGGTVNVTAAAMSGVGGVHANGGAGGAGGNIGGGGGGGGRVALTGCSSSGVPAAGAGGSGHGTNGGNGAAGSVSAVVPPSCPSAPPVPAGLAALASGEDATGRTFVTASWNPAAQANFYTLQASTASDFSGAQLSTSVFSTTGTIAGLTPLATYYLRVAAVNGIGSSAYSASVSMTAPADLTPPQAPTLASATGTTGGRVGLAWSAAASGEQTASFNLYRSSSAIVFTAGLTPILVHTPSTSYTDTPPSDGTYFYAVTALDPSFNESGLSNVLSALSLHAGPPSPTSLTAAFNLVRKQIALAWIASTGTVAGYNVYRATYSATRVAGRAPLLAGTTATALVDAPSTALDATYYYLVTAVDPVGNEGAPSNQAATPFDTHAPVIAISGVFDGQYTSANLTPVVAIADFSAFTATVTLNGRPFASGTPLTSTGTYLLSVSAVDAYANASSATAAFTIDKASPTLVLLSPPNGLVTNQNVLVSYQVSDDLTPTSKIVVTDELGSVVPSSYTIATEGTRSLTLTARDLAGNSASVSAAFILDRTPPVAVADLRVTAKSTATAQATLAWTSPHDGLSGVAGYVVKAANYPLTAANFDAAPTVATSTSPRAEGATEQFVVSVATLSTVYFAQKSSDVAGNLSAVSNVAFWDLDGPAMSIAAPAPGTIVSRPATFNLNATDLTGVAAVVFSVDGVALSTATAPPYNFFWNTLAYADGAHMLRFDALDTLGNASALAASYTLAYQPPPSPTITAPANNYTTRSATVAVAGVASVGTTVQILVDGFVVSSASVSSTGSYQAVVTLPAQGTPLLTAVAADAKGSSAQSSPVAVNYNLAPPGGPQSFSAASSPAGHVALSWTAPSGKVPSSYNVYRSTYAAAFSSGVVPSPVFLTRAAVAARSYDDLPPQDGLYYYGATSLDSSGDESGLSNAASVVSDRVVPTAALVFVGTTPPLGQGAWPVRLTLSKPLASAPLLLFTPSGQSPISLTLSASSPTVWVGTLTVASTMNSGAGAFSFQGTDFVGNVGTVLTAGGAAAIDLVAPVGSIALAPPSPEKAGSVALTLTLNKPVPSAPTLSYATAAGSTVPVVLSGSGASWSGTLTISTGSDGPAAFNFGAVDALGNAGATLSVGAGFSILTTPPGAPLFLRAIPQPAGAVRITWSAPVGGTPTAYNVYRNGVRIATGTAPLPDGSGAFTDTPADGSYTYTATAVDAAGNESAPATPVAATAKSTLPAAPVGSTATLTAFGHIEVRWQAGSADSLTYKIYRTTTAVANLNVPIANSLSSSAAFSAPASTPPYVDTPPQNALYYYYLTAFDAAGNQSLPSSPATALWDRSPPTIIVSGVQDASVYNYNVTPVFTATGSASAVATAATLNNAPFLSGTPVTTEGDYTLVVNAVNQSNGSSTTTVHFTLDKTSPTVTIAGIPSGVSHSAVLPQVTVTDLHLASVVLTLDSGAYSQGTPISANGAHAFAVTAKDAAGNVTVSSAAFTLNIPPSAPAGFTMAAVDGQGATFSWQSPAAGLAGYRFYKDGAPLSQGLLTLLQFQDPSFVFGTAHLYEVSAVDASGQEGTHAQINIPAANFSLASYGVNSNGSQALTRGFFDTIQLQLVNSGAQSQFLGPATVELISSTSTVFTGQMPAATVAAGAAVAVPAVAAVPVSVVDAPTLRVTLQLPSGLGTTATVSKSFTLAARTPLGSAVELFAGPMIFGANAQVQVKFNNKGSAPFEIRTAISSDLGVSLATPQGTVLSQATLSQTGNGAQTGSGVYFVSVGPGSSFLFDPVPVFVPSALGSNAVLSAHLVQGYNGLAGSQPAAGGQSFDAAQTISGVSAPAYTATIAPDKPLYDQGPTVTLSGVAQDSTGALVPGATVQVGVSVQSFVRSLSTMTDASGHYSLTFNPTPTEAGLYTLWATNPSVVSRIPQSSFTIVGFGLQYASLTVPVVQNATQTFAVGLTNTGQTALSSMTVRIVSTASVAGVSLALDPASLPVSLGGGQTANLSFSAVVAPGAPLGAVPFTVQLVESHGFTRTMPATVVVSASAANPAASPQSFTLGMNGGQTKLQTVVLANSGNKVWTGVTVSSPALGWVSIQGNTNPAQPFSLGDIAPGGQVQFVLSIAPASNQPSQAYALNPLVQINSTNAPPIPINALVTVTAGNTGGVVYNIINADKPRDQFGSGVPVPGASAQLVSLDIAGLSFNTTVDANSVARFGNVPAGRYNVTVKASGFNDYVGTETIQPGIVNTREILMLTQLITYIWSVTPTTIVDQYSLTLSLTYKTDVPAPVIVVSPAVFNFDLASDSAIDAQMTITNKGLISAFNVQTLPKISDSHLTIALPYPAIPELKAGQSVTVPFRVALHSPPMCRVAHLDGNETDTCAAGNTVTRQWTGPTVNVGCGVPPSIVTPSIPGLTLPPPQIAGVLPVLPPVTAGVVGVVAQAAQQPSQCTCSMTVSGPAALPPNGTATYSATATSQNCSNCGKLSCDPWVASGDLQITSQLGCTAQVKATGNNGGALTASRNGTPSCSGQKTVAGATVTFIGASGNDFAGGDAFDRINAAQGVSVSNVAPSPIRTVTANAIPASVATSVTLTNTDSTVATVSPLSPQVLGASPATVSIQGAAPGSTDIQANIPSTPPVQVGKLHVESFPEIHKSVAFHLIGDNSGLASHQATTYLSLSDIHTILDGSAPSLNSIWGQANVVFDLKSVDIVTVPRSFSDRVLFDSRTAPDYLAIIAGQNPAANFNVYFVFAVASSTSDFACGLTYPNVHHSLVSVSNVLSSGICRPYAAHVVAHEIGHAFNLDSLPSGTDYSDANRQYELMSAHADGGQTITPSQGRGANP